MKNHDYSVLCRHVERETETTQCKIIGKVPLWINGSVIYNGPGMTRVGDCEYRHAFDSSAILQRFRISNGHITYCSKFVQSQTFKSNIKSGKIMKAEYGTPGPDKGIISRLLSTINLEKLFSDNALLQVVKLGKRMFAIGEIPFLMELDIETLNVTHRWNLNKVYGHITQSVHFQQDEDGDYYTVGLAVSITGAKYPIIKIPRDGSLLDGEVLCSIPSRWRLSSGYMHALALTKQFIVLVEQPFVSSIVELMTGTLTNTPYIEGSHWMPTTQNLIHVLDRKSGKSVGHKYVTDPFFCFHFCNAWEDGDHIIIDFPGYNDSSLMHKMFIKTLRESKTNPNAEFGSSFKPNLRRLALPLEMPADDTVVKFPGTTATAKKDGSQIYCTWENLSDVSCENPAIHPAYNARPNRYIWGMGPQDDDADGGHIVKFDSITKESKIFQEDGIYPSYVVFIPHPDEKAEDSGVILSLFVKSADPNFVGLLILDSEDLSEIARVFTNTKSNVPLPFHGSFFAH